MFLDLIVMASMIQVQTKQAVRRQAGAAAAEGAARLAEIDRLLMPLLDGPSASHASNCVNCGAPHEAVCSYCGTPG